MSEENRTTSREEARLLRLKYAAYIPLEASWSDLRGARRLNELRERMLRDCFPFTDDELVRLRENVKKRDNHRMQVFMRSSHRRDSGSSSPQQRALTAASKVRPHRPGPRSPRSPSDLQTTQPDLLFRMSPPAPVFGRSASDETARSSTNAETAAPATALRPMLREDYGMHMLADVILSLEAADSSGRSTCSDGAASSVSGASIRTEPSLPASSFTPGAYSPLLRLSLPLHLPLALPCSPGHVSPLRRHAPASHATVACAMWQ